MNIVILTYYYDEGFTTPQAMIDRYETTTAFAEELVKLGQSVSVVHRYEKDEQLTRNGVDYYFVNDNLPSLMKQWQVPTKAHRLAISLKPDVVHLHSLYFAFPAWRLRQSLSNNIPIVIQDHAGRPTHRWRRHVQRYLLKPLDGFLFAADELGHAWVKGGIVETTEKLFTIMEGSSRFERQDREHTRKKMGVLGNPIFLWVGRLDENKDPLTVLSGFQQALERLDDPKLLMIYHTEELLADVKTFLEERPALAERVTLVGRVTHAEMEAYYNCADYFVLGSHHEGSGYALCEALACGVVPIVTNIPSFHMMLDGGNFGALWLVGNASSFTVSLLSVVNRPLEAESAKALAFFEEKLSFPGIARETLKVYETVVERRKTSHGYSRKTRTNIKH